MKVYILFFLHDRSLREETKSLMGKEEQKEQILNRIYLEIA